VDVMFFTRLFIWGSVSGHVISRWIQQRQCIKFCANLGKSAMETLAIVRQALKEESMSHTRVFETKKARQVRSKLKSMLIIFLDIQGIVHKEFVPEGQTVHSACY
jgi:hypothetical protein